MRRTVTQPQGRHDDWRWETYQRRRRDDANASASKVREVSPVKSRDSTHREARDTWLEL